MYVSYIYTLPVPPIAWIIIAVIVGVIVFALIAILLPVMLFSIRVGNDEILIAAPPLMKFRVRKSDIESATVISLSKCPELHPKIRLYGIGLPGWRVGWYRLNNGSKAFVALSQEDRVLLLRMRGGELVLLAPNKFSEFLAVLHRLGWIS